MFFYQNVFLFPFSLTYQQPSDTQSARRAALWKSDIHKCLKEWKARKLDNERNRSLPTA